MKKTRVEIDIRRQQGKEEKEKQRELEKYELKQIIEHRERKQDKAEYPRSQHRRRWIKKKLKNNSNSSKPLWNLIVIGKRVTYSNSFRTTGKVNIIKIEVEQI